MTEQCPICGSKSQEIEKKSSREFKIECVRCGIFKYSKEVHTIVDKLSEINKMALSHWIRKLNQNGVHPTLLEHFPEKDDLIKLKLPNPAEQADNLILYLGENQKKLSSYLEFSMDKLYALCAVIGCMDLFDLEFLIVQMYDYGLLTGLLKEHYKYPEKDFFILNHNYKLTFEGWQKYEVLKNYQSKSKQVFMAMKFKESETDNLYHNFLKKAVEETGLNIVRIDEIARAGIIDNNMRLEIRKSCLLLSELTHDNNGAYFEAGFAEGMDIPVIYLCEKEKFEEHKTHFDTNHCTTIIWEKGKELEAMEKLKATIRLSVPEKVKIEDRK